jgi:integrating conjugative element protein (TIGR03749 family)
VFTRYCFITLIGTLLLTQQALADPLLLSDADMKKLKNYFPAQDDSPHFVWNGDPIAIQLPLNKEKRIVFPSHITVDVKGQLTTDQLHILNNDKSIYITALKPFPSIRVYVTLQTTNEVVLMDLSTDDKASTQTTYIDIKQNNSANALTSVASSTVTNHASLSAATNDNNNANTDGETYVTLIRYAWQQLYAPERLLTSTPNVSRAAMHAEPFISTLVYGDKVIAHPEISWVYNDTYVTAVQLRNKYPHATQINIARDLCGNWQAVTIYPSNYLKLQGNKAGDSATLFLVSKKPFAESMEVCNGHA